MTTTEAKSGSHETIDRYCAQIAKHDMLSCQEESALARRYRDSGDMNAAHTLVRANLRFVVKIAHGYRGYKVDLEDLIQEGNLGLMAAVKKFDPDRGYRLISYAVWWIHAFIKAFILRTWSLVRIGTTQAQRKLFFKLRSARARIGEQQEAEVSLGELAADLGVSEKDVALMDARMSARDASLHTTLTRGGTTTRMELLTDASATPEEVTSKKQLRQVVQARMRDAVSLLKERETYVLAHRIMADEPETLREIGSHFGITRERARQIQSNVTRKIRPSLEAVGLGLAV